MIDLHKNWKGEIGTQARSHPLVRRFFELVNCRQMTIAAIARRSGVRRNSIFKWRESTPTLPSLEAALNVLGYRLAIVPLEDTRPQRPQHSPINTVHPQ